MNKLIKGRKKLLLNRPYQVKFVISVLIVIILATCVSTLASYILMMRGIEGGFYSVHRSLRDIRALIMPVIAISGLMTLGGMAFLGAFITLRETHRVIGPTEKLESKFMEMSVGDFTLMQSFRKDDVLKGLDDFINVHLNTMSDYFIILDGSVTEIRNLIVNVKSGAASADDLAEQLANITDSIEKSASAFRQE